MHIFNTFKESNIMDETTPDALPAPSEASVEPAIEEPMENDLEDGEIEDDEDDEEIGAAESATKPNVKDKDKSERGKHDRERRRHDDKKRNYKAPMTEAEKSILHLRKRERFHREKWEKYRKEQHPTDVPVDDFAISLEKQLASMLKKDSKHNSDEEKEDDNKRGKKRKNRDKDRAKESKQRKTTDSPKSDFDGGESSRSLESLAKSVSPEDKKPCEDGTDDSAESENDSDDRREKRKELKRTRNRNRDRSRRRSREHKGGDQQQQTQTQPTPLKDAQGVCVFFLQGKCQKNDCPYSHEAVPPMKLELCKFYLKDCCAKGEKCSYMHEEFPCKFYHTGLACLQGDTCKFAHGKPLDVNRRQILFKHIETAPREILGGFPRMSREEALNNINLTQQKLLLEFGPDTSNNIMQSFLESNLSLPPELNDPSKPSKCDKPSRNRPSRWQDADPPLDAHPVNFPPIQPPFNCTQDQDMRITSNGDIDMRTLPPLTQQPSSSLPRPTTADEQPSDPEPPNFTQDIDIRNPNMIQFDTKDIDIRQQILATKDVDIRQIPPVFNEAVVVTAAKHEHQEDEDEEPMLQIDTGEEPEDEEELPPPMPNLPKTQRDLYMRIQSQQKTNLPEEPDVSDVQENINWYSDDDDEDENRLTIKVDNDEEKKEEAVAERPVIMSPPQIKPLEVVEQLGDLSKIDISAEVTRLLTSMTQTANATAVTTPPSPKAAVTRDPRQRSSADKLSIYEQGSINPDDSTPQSPDDSVDVEFRSRPDVDLRSLHLPFKGMLNYTPAKEIHASVDSHPPMPWKVMIVEIPRPDYTGLKLNVQDAEKTGDPRLKKIFRLSVEESPASPKASPKSTVVTRVDPRLKKQEENKQQDSNNLSYNQQMNILQSSAFFQSLTSNQKVLLNQELASQNDQNGFNDPVLGSMLSTLNLVPNSGLSNPNMGAAQNILANVNKLTAPMMGTNQPPPMVMRQNQIMGHGMVQPGLLGAAPGIPNMPPDFPMGFGDPRNGAGGMMGNMPPPPGPFGNFAPQQQDNNFGNFDEYYPNQDNYHPSGNNRDHRHFNRDRRRGGGRNFNRNGGNRNFRNRNNRNHTPP